MAFPASPLGSMPLHNPNALPPVAHPPVSPLAGPPRQRGVGAGDRAGAVHQALSALLNGGMNPAAPPSGHIDSGYNPAAYQRQLGHTGQAVADWEAHHPWAMAHDRLPGWVKAYLASQLSAGVQTNTGNPLAAAAGGGLPVS